MFCLSLRHYTEGYIDTVLINDELDTAVQHLKDIISDVRPDVIAPATEDDAIPRPLVVCGPTTAGKKEFIARLMEEHEAEAVQA